jgi:EAL domain-containing protein (putative c-di-GMP-specific phosphodiesterase class I)
MYRAKAERKNAISFYNREIQKQADERLLMERELRRAIQRREFEILFQPQIDRNGVIAGSEVLVRWNHPSRGLILPAEFIPIAEETGLILELGEQILETACKLTRHLSVRDIAVNISPLQFHHPDFIDTVERILRRTGMDSTDLIMEVTEGIVIENIEDTASKMNTLKEQGIRFSIDDFGTGYSSLAYLRQLPLDQLKINNRFVGDIGIDQGGEIIVETILSMASHLGLKVVAEGVETEGQLEFLIDKGCPIFQGFFFGVPLRHGEFETYLAGGLRSRKVALVT